MIKRLLAACAAMAVFLSGIPLSYAVELSEQRYIVRFRDSDARAMGAGLAKEALVEVVGEEELFRLLKEKRILWFERDYSVELFEGELVSDGEETDNEQNLDEVPETTDTSEKKYDESQWELSMIAADFTYMINCVGQNVKIGVIDSGIAPHEDLQGNVLQGYDYLNDSEDTTDTYGHGTFVSGLIAALDDGKGMIGVAPKAKLVPLKCFSAKTTNVSVICKAIYGAVDDYDCDIINMSFGLAEDSRALREAIEYAEEKGVLVVAAVGNYGSDTLYYPAAYDSVIGVGAVDPEGSVYAKSQHNESVFITAPGVSVKSTSYRGGYTTGSGTSYSTPLVTAAVAVMKTVNESVTWEQVKAILAATAVDRGQEGYDEYYGNGILNLHKGAESMLKNIRCFLSPVQEEEDYAFAVLYNPSEEDFTGSFLAGEYLGRAVQKLDVQNFTVPAGHTIQVECGLPENSARYFVWESPENNAVVSNTRVKFVESQPENPAEAVTISVDLTDDDLLTAFALSVFNTGGKLIYAVQDIVPEDRTYEILVPRSSLIGVVEPDIGGGAGESGNISEDDLKNGTGEAENIPENDSENNSGEAVNIPENDSENNTGEAVNIPENDSGNDTGQLENIPENDSENNTGEAVNIPENDSENNSGQSENISETEALCGLALTVYINGTKSVLPLAAHAFEETVVPPTQDSQGYTEHVCRQCGYSYRDAATMPFGFSVAYDANGGDGAPEAQNKQPSVALTLSNEVPVRQGYSFLGWSTDPKSEMPMYEAGGEYIADADTVLYALWQVNVYKLTYTLDGEVYKTLELAYGASVAAEKAPTKSGYTFSGWSNLPETMPAQDVTVIGNFVSNGGGGGGGIPSYWPSSVAPLPADNKTETEKKPGTSAENQDLPDEEDYTVELFSFLDVKEEDWYYESIRRITHLGLMQGIAETEFAPEMTVTRGMFVTVLYRLDGEPVEGEENAFIDVPEDAYYAPAVRWAFANRIVSGVSEQRFAPENFITREQMAVMMHRYAVHQGYTALLSPQTGVCLDEAEISPFALNAVQWAFTETILKGSDDGCFYPKRNASRAETAAICVRLYDKLEEYLSGVEGR